MVFNPVPYSPTRRSRVQRWVRAPDGEKPIFWRAIPAADWYGMSSSGCRSVVALASIVSQVRRRDVESGARCFT